MSKKLNITGITNDLEGSAFFPSRKPTPAPITYSPIPQIVPESPIIKLSEEEKKPNVAVEKTVLLAKKQTNKEANAQTTKAKSSEHSPLSKTDNQQDSSLFTTKEKVKYGTYLTEESIEKIRIIAIQTKRDDHQIIQAAVNQYLEGASK